MTYAMNKKSNKIYLSLLLCILYPACINTRPQATSPNGLEPTPPIYFPDVSIVTLEDIYPSLMEKARNWDKDAYLVEIDIPLQSMVQGISRVWLVSAQFQTPNLDRESLIVTMNINGGISKKLIKHSLSIKHVDPINIGDWEIDTEDLILVLREYGLAISQHDPEICFTFKLRRIPKFNHEVMWRVFEEGCMSLSGPDNIYYVDALTGLVLE